MTGFAEPKIDEDGTDEPTSATGNVRGWSWSFGRSVSSGAFDSLGVSLAGSVDLVQGLSLKILKKIYIKHRVYFNQFRLINSYPSVLSLCSPRL